MKNISDHILFLINPIVNIFTHFGNNPLVNILLMLESIYLSTVYYPVIRVYYIEKPFFQFQLHLTIMCVESPLQFFCIRHRSAQCHFISPTLLLGFLSAPYIDNSCEMFSLVYNKHWLYTGMNKSFFNQILYKHFVILHFRIEPKDLVLILADSLLEF